jgi:hypothetical protein
MSGITVEEMARMLYAKGVRFHVDLEAVGGGRTFELMPRDIELFRADQEAWEAKAWGVSKDAYRAWKQAGGFPQCVGNTTAGRRCRNGVANALGHGGMVDPPEFEELEGGYCHLHGG